MFGVVDADRPVSWVVPRRGHLSGLRAAVFQHVLVARLERRRATVGWSWARLYGLPSASSGYAQWTGWKNGLDAMPTWAAAEMTRRLTNRGLAGFVDELRAALDLAESQTGLDQQRHRDG